MNAFYTNDFMLAFSLKMYWISFQIKYFYFYPFLSSIVVPTIIWFVFRYFILTNKLLNLLSSLCLRIQLIFINRICYDDLSFKLLYKYIPIYVITRIVQYVIIILYCIGINHCACYTKFKPRILQMMSIIIYLAVYIYIVKSE